MSIVHRCVSPPEIVSLLRVCKSISNLEQVHAQIIHRGLEQDPYLIANIICLCNTYTSDVCYPTSVFNRVVQPNAHLWNSIVKLHCMHSSLSDALSVFVDMKRSDISPDAWTFSPLIKACSGELALREGQAIHALSFKYGLDSDVYVGSSFIDLYGKCCEIECARKVFDELSNKNVVSWTALISGYVNAGNLVVAKRLFDETPNKNHTCWNAMMRGFAKFGDMENARKLFERMPRRSRVSFTTMIDGYAKTGEMTAARLLFEQSPELNIVSWSVLLSGYVQNGQPKEAMNVFREMRSRKIEPDEYIMVSLMSACSQVGSLELANEIDSYTSQRFGCRRGVHVTTALIDMHTKCGSMVRARKLFDEMPKRNPMSYCSMIQGMSSHGCGEEAVELFSKMLSEGLTPDDVAFTVILNACSQAGLVKEGCHYFDLMINKYSITPSPEHYGCIIDLLGRCGMLNTGYDLLKTMPIEPHAAAWGALLGACTLHYNVEIGEKVANYLFEIERNNSSNYVALSNIYAEASRWCDVSKVRSKMNEMGIKKITGLSSIRSKEE